MICALALAGLLAAPLARAEDVRIALLHTTDLHGALDDVDYLANAPARRGLTRVATLVRRVRDSGVPTLLVDGGDCIEGGGVEWVYQHGDRHQPDPMIAAMNAIGYDAMAVGNHEFSFGLDVLRGTERQAHFPFLSANAKRADGTAEFAASLVKVVGGVRVGIVGLTTPAVPFLEDPAHVAGLRFDPPIEAARAEVLRLRGAEHCDVIVLLAHTGLEKSAVRDSTTARTEPDENWGGRLATWVQGVDVVILGHTHVVVPSLEIDGVLVTQAGKWGENLGRVDLTLTRDSAGGPWRLTRRTAQMLAVTDSVGVDPDVARLAAPVHDATQSALSRVVGQAARELTSPRGRAAPSAIWELVQRAQLDASGADVSLAPLFDTTARIAPGPITLRDVLRVYPYTNTFGAVMLTGAELRQTLEESARYFATWDAGPGSALASGDVAGFNADAAFGVGYEIDLTRPPGDRIRNLTFQGAPLAADRVVAVAMSDYRMNGGGGFTKLRGAPRKWRSPRAAQDDIAAYLAKSGALDGSTTRNWRVVPEYVASPERPLIDRLVRSGVTPREELMRMEGDQPAKRGDVAYWLARAFGWRARKLSGAFADVPDSLEPWLDGLMQHGVLGAAAKAERIEPFRDADAWTGLAWCEGAARAAGWAVARDADPAFRRGLLAGTSLTRDALRENGGASLTLDQLLGIVSNTRFPTIRVLETTDFHGNILPGARERRSRRAVGGSSVLAAWVAKLRAENPEGTVLLDGGDWFQGTMISNLQYGRPVVEQMNDLGYTAAAIGNHDFDWSADTLAERAAEMRFATLGANCVVRKTGRRPRYARADTLVTRRGVRIGILGLCYVGTPTVTLPANVAHLRFDDDSTAAARLAPQLRRREHAKLVLGVGHIPAETDSTMRAKSGDLLRLAHVRGVDAWFGGHSHNQIVDDVGGVPVMIAGAHAEVVGVCDLTVDPLKGTVIEKQARLQPTFADEVAPDSTVAAAVTRWNAAIAPLAAVPLGRAARRLTRGGDSTIGYLVTDAMRAAVGADVALQNSGGLRADLAEGEITRGAVYEVMPFDNTIVTVDLTGAQLRAVFDDGLKGGHVPQVSGLKFVFDLSRPADQRLVSIALADGTALDGAKTYKVAVNNFMATGGDGFTSIAKGSHLKDTTMNVRDAMEAFIKAKCANGGAIDYAPESRGTRAGGDSGGTR
ncbi:MAG TPA: 5'-nucleotidase C-terminal domain-containing protein [Candidatus Saccharimonadaceae bacterium]|jgi:2',3'-cyclic-nucleotide 2'-phosphodiesterase/3'-nucleotidase|nr:5'-nucleotidase C-terminal domain-containing protein [Candidatus Saccharimonadaceae bacterium]